MLTTRLMTHAPHDCIHSLMVSYAKNDIADPGATAATRAPHPAKSRFTPSFRATERAIAKTF
jgi:hypothetical protein